MAHSSIRNHFKLYALADSLGVSRATALGHLEFLWQSAYESPSVGLDGVLTNWTAKHIDRMAEWTGDVSFADSAVAAGFLERGANSYLIHDYADWIPAYVKKRIDRRVEADTESKRKIRGRRSDAGRTPIQGKERQGKETEADRSQGNESRAEPRAPEQTATPIVDSHLRGNGSAFANARSSGTAIGNGAVLPEGFEKLWADTIGRALELDPVRMEEERHYLTKAAMRFIGLPDWRKRANESIALAQAKLKAQKNGKLQNAFGAWRADLDKSFEQNGEVVNV